MRLRKRSGDLSAKWSENEDNEAEVDSMSSEDDEFVPNPYDFSDGKRRTREEQLRTAASSNEAGTKTPDSRALPETDDKAKTVRQRRSTSKAPVKDGSNRNKEDQDDDEDLVEPDNSNATPKPRRGTTALPKDFQISAELRLRKSHPAYQLLHDKLKEAFDSLLVPYTDVLVEELRVNPAGAPYSRKGPRVDHRVAKWNRRSRSRTTSRSRSGSRGVASEDENHWGIDSRRPAQRGAVADHPESGHKGAASKKRKRKTRKDGEGEESDSEDEDGEINKSPNGVYLEMIKLPSPTAPSSGQDSKIPKTDISEGDVCVSIVPDNSSDKVSDGIASRSKGHTPRVLGSSLNNGSGSECNGVAIAVTNINSIAEGSSSSSSGNQHDQDKESESKATVASMPSTPAEPSAKRKRGRPPKIGNRSNATTPSTCKKAATISAGDVNDEETPRGRTIPQRRASIAANKKLPQSGRRGKSTTRKRIIESDEDPLEENELIDVKDETCSSSSDNDLAPQKPPKCRPPPRKKQKIGSSASRDVSASAKDKGKDKIDAPPRPILIDETIKNVLVVQQVLVEGGDLRYKCVVPCCDKDFLNVNGLKYHMQNHVHEVLEVLAWAFPSTPDNAPVGSGETLYKYDRREATYPLIMMDRIRQDIRPLYDNMRAENFPVLLEEYSLLIPGLTNPSYHGILLGFAREHQTAYEKRIRRLRKNIGDLAATEGNLSTASTPSVPRKPKRSKKGKEKATDGDEAKPSPRSKIPEAGVGGRPPGKKTLFPNDFAKKSSQPIPTLNQLEPLMTTEWTDKLAFDEFRPMLAHYVMLSPEQAVDYKPTGPPDYNISVAASENGPATAPHRLPLFESHPFESCGDDKSSHSFFLLNTGCAIWGLDWAPGIESADETQYLAVAGYRGTMNAHHVLGHRQIPSGPDDKSMKGIIQFWSLGRQITDTKKGPSEEPPVHPKLEMCLAHDFGDVFSLEWCPYGGYESLAMYANKMNQQNLRRLGLLAVSFGDGLTRVLAIPEPRELRRAFHMDDDDNAPFYVKCNHCVLELGLPNTMLWKLSWGGHSRLATATTNGTVQIWSMDEAAEQYRAMSEGKVEGVDIDPLCNFYCHDSVVIALKYRDELSRIYDSEWRSRGTFDGSIPKPNQLVTSGTDGKVILHDLRMPTVNVQIARFRAFLTGLTYASHNNVILFPDNEHIVRQTFMGVEDFKGARNKEEDEVINKNTSSWLMYCKGYIWQLECSRFIPFVAAASSDGTLRIANVNRSAMLRSTKPVVVPVYRMEWKPDENLYTFYEHLEIEDQPLTKNKPDHPLNTLFPQNVTIQRVAWSPNRVCASWVATGGRNGLVRLESVFNL
ncbi:hypothetical protein SeMB42_g03180 [Synchytrium endobioticum]|uniref:C2H2-type domain-containing protein n=1 Tax=Synchytrium endobioticum TaxID=286115 RepID=A0A507D8T1_9FUNG|nr:hypothetical protein SeLEV6574_g04743 [Synchytrium endobioticum]TPX47841.1 hypothetical protein SeMB42_g03180 [Synchytrium endobioticum]